MGHSVSTGRVGKPVALTCSFCCRHFLLLAAVLAMVIAAAWFLAALAPAVRMGGSSGSLATGLVHAAAAAWRRS